MSQFEPQDRRNGKTDPGAAGRKGDGQDGPPRQQSPGRNPLYRAALRHFDRGDWETGTILLDSLNQYGVPQPAEEVSSSGNGRQGHGPQANAEDHKEKRIAALARENRFSGQNGDAPGNGGPDLAKELSQELGIQDGRMFREHPLYRSMQRHMAQEEWERALLVADNLVLSFPYEEGLSAIRRDIQVRAKKGSRGPHRKRWLSALALLCLLIFSMCGLFYSYVRNPSPLAEMVALASDRTFKPHYLFSVYGTDEPVGVAVSPTGDRIYVSETGGERLVRIFDRQGEQIGSFTPPNTQPAQRAPVYLSVDSRGNVYMTDRMQHAVFIFDRDGEYLETLLAPQLTLTEFVSQHAGSQSEGIDFSLNLFTGGVSAVASVPFEETSLMSDLPEWSPLGIRIDQEDRLILTDVTRDRNAVQVLQLDGSRSPESWSSFEPPVTSYGASGSGEGEFLFPNSAVTDSLGRVYVSDGNNGRISVWDGQGRFLYDFGGGSGEGSVSLPRGLAMDARDRLYVVDTVGQRVNVYGVGGSEPEFLFAFGDFGLGDGLFNYPGDIAMDQSGRLYITDRENNRVQVWSY